MSYRIEGRDLVIDGFEKGIAPSPYEGIADMRNVNTISVPTEVSTSFAMTANRLAVESSTACTVQDTGDTITYTPSDGEDLYNGACITFASTANGLTAGTLYWVKDTGSSVFQVYTDFAEASGYRSGTPVAITSDGSNSFTQLVMGLPKHWAYDSGGTMKYFVQDSNARVWGLHETSKQWVFLNNSVAVSGSGNGLVAYHGWVIAFFDKNYAYLDTDFYTTTWTASSFVLKAPGLSALTHYAMVGYDDTIYYCDGNFIGASYSLSDYFRGVVLSANTGTDYLTCQQNDGGLPNVGDTIVFTLNPSQTIPAGLTAETTYYVHSLGSSTFTTFDIKVSATLGGAAVNITSDETCGFRDTRIGNSSQIWNYTALELPGTEKAQAIAELGENLLIGATSNLIYPWDRISNGFQIPIRIAENNVSSMVTVNTNTYIFAGNRGRIYVTNGSQAELFMKIPDALSGAIEPYYTWGAFGYNRNQLYFGISATNNAGSALTTMGGLWAIDIDYKSLRLVNKLSYDTYAGYPSVFVPVQEISGTSNGFGFYCGWSNGTTYGIDATSADPYANYETYIDTDIIPVGRLWTRRTFEQIEFLLGAPLVANEGVKIEYRTNLTDGFTAVADTNETTTVGAIADVYTPSFENVQWIQLRIYLKSTASTPSYTRLREVRIR